MQKAVTVALSALCALLMLAVASSSTEVVMTSRGKPVHIAKVRTVRLTDEEAWELLDSVQWPK